MGQIILVGVVCSGAAYGEHRPRVLPNDSFRPYSDAEGRDDAEVDGPARIVALNASFARLKIVRRF